MFGGCRSGFPYRWLGSGLSNRGWALPLGLVSEFPYRWLGNLALRFMDPYALLTSGHLIVSPMAQGEGAKILSYNYIVAKIIMSTLKLMIYQNYF